MLLGIGKIEEAAFTYEVLCDIEIPTWELQQPGTSIRRAVLQGSCKLTKIHTIIQKCKDETYEKFDKGPLVLVLVTVPYAQTPNPGHKNKEMNHQLLSHG